VGKTLRKKHDGSEVHRGAFAAAPQIKNKAVACFLGFCFCFYFIYMYI
jgi:hypothetical protein